MAESNLEVQLQPRLLHSPLETRTWLVLHQGYLLKTKIKALRKSTKLRLFVLKQNPNTMESRIEYYEGYTPKGGVSLENAKIHVEKDGVFHILTPSRTFYLQSEKGNLATATAWVLAIHRAIVKQESAKKSRESMSSPQKPAPAPTPAVSASTTSSNTAAIEGSIQERRAKAGSIDGAKIDAARWAALRKSMAVDVQPDFDDDDLRMLREAEEEEERRQEQERLAWQAAKLSAQDQPPEPEPPVSATRGDESEDDDFEEQMRLAEEEEERRQQAEREAFLAKKS
eukprot:m.237458 g.237458  ORF g.237458 m.237458 type:complete len:284 (-) comp13143_c0_seq1:98-949(-)